MSTKNLGYIPRSMRFNRFVPRTASVTTTAASLLLSFTAAASAQTVSGAIDPSTGLSNLAPYFLGLAATASILIAAWKGGHAVAEGRSLGPSIVGLVGGLALSFGGYYILSKYGVSTAA